MKFIRSSFVKFLIVSPLFSYGCLASAAGFVFEDNFKSYPDFDPGLRNWQFRGVGGEIIDGSYQFTGVTQKQSEYLDIPDHTIGFVRDFKAGSKLKVNATLKTGLHKYPVFKPEEGSKSLCGILISGRGMIRKEKTQIENMPILELSFRKSADGKRSIYFDYAGPKAATESKDISSASDWKDAVDYTFEIVFSDNKAIGSIKEGSKTIFEKEISSPDFASLFAKTYPGFVNQRMTGQLSYFKADNMNSDTQTETALPLQIPQTWKLFPDVKNASKLGFYKSIPDSIPDAGAPLSQKIESGKVLNIGALLGGHKAGKAAVLFANVNVKSAGIYYLKCKADWFWRLDVNGNTALNLMSAGNGPNQTHTLALQLQAGDNCIMIVSGSGSAGWDICLSEANDSDIKNALAKRYVFGSDTLYWNLDRLLDDILKLQRDKITIEGLGEKISALKKSLPPNLSARDIAKHDTFLDEAFAKVYDGYRALQLKNSIEEQKALASVLNSKFNDSKIAELEKLLPKIMKEVNAGDGSSVEKTAAAAQKILDECKKNNQGYVEGVSKGGSFGRFGWMTSASIGSYSSGDGLLANQVLSNGALARQYISKGDMHKSDDCWVARFRFDGIKDAAKASELGSLKTLAQNVALQFGYDPTQFYTGSTPENVAVKEISWTHKRFACADGFVADMSILSPSLLIESPYNKLVLSDPAGASMSYMGYLDADSKAAALPAGKNGVIYDATKNQKPGANWVLFWSDANTYKDLSGHSGSVPLQVIFQYQPQKIERSGSDIIITLGKNGAIWLNTPYGARLQPTGNWQSDLPPSAIAKCNLFARAALAYPQDCREFYRLSQDGSRIEILDKIKFRYFRDNDWNLEPLELSPLPPLLSLLVDQGFDAELPKEIFDLKYPSAYGPLYAVKGGTLSYSLPVPEAPRLHIPGNPEADATDKDLIAKRTAANVEGMRVRLYDERIARSWCSLSYPMGALTAKPWSYLDPVYRDYLKGLFSYNMEASSGYRSNRMWRSLVEPYSGRKYFYSFSIKIDDPGDVGVFGDRGYGVGNHLNNLDYSTAFTGSYDTLRKIWKDKSPLAPSEASKDGKILSVDKMTGYVKDVHDWAWMTDGSNDAGDNGPVVDCGQAAFGGQAALYRMAKEVGSQEDIAEAAYYLAKGLPALIGRGIFTDFGHQNGLLGMDNINVGYREFITPESYANSPMIIKTMRQEYDGSFDSLLCYAWQDMYEIYYPYGKYVWNNLREWEDARQLYFPNSDDRKDTHGHLGTRLVYLLFDGTPVSRVREILKNKTESSVFYLRNMQYLETMPLLITGGSPFVLAEWAPLKAPDFKFVPSKKTAYIKLDSVPAGFRLKGFSSQKPETVRINGKAADYSYDPESFVLTVDIPKSASSELELKYAEIDQNHFMPVPLQKAPKSVPALEKAFYLKNFERAAPVKENSSKDQTQTQNKTASPLYTADFSGEPSSNPLNAGGFFFADWGKVKQQPSGGLTGAYPKNGAPPLSLEVKATADNFTGRNSKTIEIPADTSEIIISGKVMRSKDYKGNNPMIFLWVTDKDKKSKPFFFKIPGSQVGEWQNIEFTWKSSEMPGTANLILNLTSQKDQSGNEPAGSIFYKDISISARK